MPFFFLDDGQSLSLINMVRNIKTYGAGSNEYRKFLDDKDKMFKIELSSGESYELTASPKCIVIDGKGYEANEDILKKINDFYVSLFGALNPFSWLTPENVKEISVYKRHTMDISYTLTDEEKKAVIAELKTVEIQDFDDYIIYMGTSDCEYRIVTDFGKLDISLDNVLKVNGKSYPLSKGEPKNTLKSIYAQYS